MKKTIVWLSTLSCLFLLAACASPYQINGLPSAAREDKLSSNSYMITGNGNGYSSQRRINEYSLLRAAEVTLQNGYKYFAITAGQLPPPDALSLKLPYTKITITMYQTALETKQPYYDAVEVRKKLGAKYKID